jgi:hypothetical protein
MALALGSLVEIETTVRSEEYAVPAAPSRAFPKDYHAIPLPRSQDDIELENVQWGRRASRPASGTQTPRTPNDLEMSRPASPMLGELDSVDAMQSFSDPPMNRFRMAAVCLLNLSNGMSDSAPGALIPYIEKYSFRNILRDLIF